MDINDNIKNNIEKYLTFSIENDIYAISIQNILEITGIQYITEVPDMQSFIKGVINLRGKIIPIMNIRTRFGIPEKEYDEKTCIIIAIYENTCIGLIVDTVSEVIDIPSNCIEYPPRINSNDKSRFILGMGKINNEIKIILDIKKILYDEK